MGAPQPIGEAEAAALLSGLEDADRLVLAVSGGPDSVALMLLAARWADGEGRPALHIVTVDHGMREGSAEEAARVLRWATDLGLSAEIVRLAVPTGSDHATLRDARYAGLAEAARRVGADHVVTAHHHDDQAETVLLRLARGSGLRGLRGMLALRTLHDDGLSNVLLARPLLPIRPERLRATCEAAAHPWIADPSNADPRYARAQLRALRPRLDALGLTPDRLVAAADGFARANSALDHYAVAALQDLRVTEIGLVGLPRAHLDAPADVARRIVEALLDIVRGGLPYPPRLERVLRIERWLREGGEGRRVLQGCVVTAPRGPDGLVTVHREAGREGLPRLMLAPGQTATFDNRYVVAAGADAVTVRAAEPGLTRPKPDWASAQAWRETCLAAPVIEDAEGARWLCDPREGGGARLLRDRVDAAWRAMLVVGDRGADR